MKDCPNLGAECGGLTSLTHPALQRYKKIRLEPISGGFFFVLEDFWGVELGNVGGVPGGELCRVAADDGD